MIFVKDAPNCIDVSSNGSLKVENDLHSFLNEHAALFIDDVLEEMPPNKKRGDDDHRIDLIPGSSPPNKPLYRFSQVQQEEIMSQVNELVQKGVFFDDIIVYSKSLEEHKAHLKAVFQALQENKLYINRKKSEFFLEEIHYLSHIISKDGIRMDPQKLEVNILTHRSGEPKRASRNLLVRANMSDKGFQNPLSPFQPRSRTGVYLADLLTSNPDLIHTAVEHELEALAENREADANQIQFTMCGEADVSLYKRIAELKSQERFDALEEILYMLIVQKFVGAQITMVPSIPTFLAGDMSWPLQFKELESVHSTEALDLILEHSLLVLGKQAATKYFSSSTFAHMGMKAMKEIYVDSTIYGYFMRRLNNRFRLERVMNSCSAKSPQEVGGRLTPEIAAAMSILRDLRGSNSMLISEQLKTSEFLAYILSFDAESLKEFRSIRAKVSHSIVNKHAEALFKELDFRLSSDGSMRVGGKDEGTQLNFLRSKGLVLEAVAFGSFLWDVETYVDSYYSIVNN
ncbi:hypothetical protein L7F22_038613 [Adiantum nelumboides]|nr:hypothetical protein [Adiantum nelumboides]